MFFGQIEKELLCGEIWSIWQTTKLPEHLQLLADQELGKRDIWELQTQKPKRLFEKYLAVILGTC